MYYDFIRSRAIREYYQKEKIELTDKQIVALIFLQSYRIHDRLVDIEKIKAYLTDVEVISDIDNYITCINKNYEYMKVHDNSEVYIIYMDDCNNTGCGYADCFRDFSSAFEAGKQNSDHCFSICKTILFDGNNPYTDESNLLTIQFDISGNMIVMYGYKMDGCGFDIISSHGHSFSDYYRFPYPFRYGDIIKVNNFCGNGEICRFIGFNEKQYNEFMKSEFSEWEKVYGYDDYKVPVEFINNPHIDETVEDDICPLVLDWKGDNKNE